MIYAQRLLDRLGASGHETHVVLSAYAQTVIQQELPDGLRLAKRLLKGVLSQVHLPLGLVQCRLLEQAGNVRALRLRRLAKHGQEQPTHQGQADEQRVRVVFGSNFHDHCCGPM